MGTNYYLDNNTCSQCGRKITGERLHIGKSSAGWCFSLRTYPEEGIHDLWDWMPLFFDPNNAIFDEYGFEITPVEMISKITERSSPSKSFPYLDSDCEEGPNGLVRHSVGNGICVGHGVGTWDLMLGEFC